MCSEVMFSFPNGEIFVKGFIPSPPFKILALSYIKFLALLQ